MFEALKEVTTHEACFNIKRQLVTINHDMTA